MATISYKIFEKKFKNEVSKKAYLEACKWISQKIIKNSEINENVNYKIKKLETKIPTFIVEIYFSIEEEKIKEMFCKNCKHLYSVFYQLDRMNCSECKMKAYRKNAEEYSKSLVEIYKKIFEEDEWNETE